MKILKDELVRALDKLKGLVVKNDQFPALGCAMVADGYLIGANSEITLKVNLEGSRGTRLLIPMRAFDLIRNLPEGEVEISEDANHTITIKTGKICNTYQSYPADDFPYNKPTPPFEGTVKLPGQQLISLLRSVLYAASDKAIDMTGAICLEVTERGLNAIGLDGHVVAWNWIADKPAMSETLLIPKSTVRKIVSMGIADDVYVTHDKSSAVFMTDDYVLFTRLLAGNYYKYDQIYKGTDGGTLTILGRKSLLEAMARAKSCVMENKPVVLSLKGDRMRLEINDGSVHYSEELQLESIYPGELRIGFDSHLVLETIKAFSGDQIEVVFTNARGPAVFQSERETHLRSLILPVAIGS